MLRRRVKDGFLRMMAVCIVPLLACTCLVDRASTSGGVQLPTKAEYEKASRVMTSVARKAETLLTRGMELSDIYRLMGQPLAEICIHDRVVMLSYADSVSGTFAYWVVVKDERLDYHGQAQTSWLIDRCTAGLLLDLARKANASLRPGMPKAQVVDVLGQPREIQDLVAGIQILSWNFGEGHIGKEFCVVLKNGLVDYFAIAQLDWLKDFYAGD